jgi:hypothetical protein
VTSTDPTERLILAWQGLCAELEPRRWLLGEPGAPHGDELALGSQAELVEWLRQHLSDGLAVRAWPGNPDRARAGTLRAWVPADPRHPLVARVRWLPPSLYRAAGFLLLLEKDCRALTSEVEAGRTAGAGACFVDFVGVASPERAAGWRQRYPRIAVLGWSARWGRFP